MNLCDDNILPIVYPRSCVKTADRVHANLPALRWNVKSKHINKTKNLNKIIKWLPEKKHALWSMDDKEDGHIRGNFCNIFSHVFETNTYFWNLILKSFFPIYILEIWGLQLINLLLQGQ